MNQSLFESERLRLTPPDPDQDAAIESAWTHDADFLRRIDPGPARPLSAGQVKKKYEQLEKEEAKQFYFAIRRREPPGDGAAEGPGRLIGFARIYWIDWVHGAAVLNLGLGAPADRGQGYGGEAMRLLLRYAFEELGLHRLGANTFEYSPEAARFLERHGFTLEVRRRQAVQRDGRRWDTLMFGLLRADWERQRAAVNAAQTMPAVPAANGANGG